MPISKEKLEAIGADEYFPTPAETVEMANELLALRWKPITPESLPTMADEVGRWHAYGGFETGSVGIPGPANIWIGRGWTHYRSIYPPAKEPK